MIEKLKTIQDDIKEYHSKDCISASGLKLIYQKSLGHYLQKEYKQTSAMELGVQVHDILQTSLEEFHEQYFVIPKLDMRLKKNKEFVEQLKIENKSKAHISNDNYKICLAIYTNAKNSNYVMPYLKGKHELSHYGEYKGVPVRVRPDTLSNDWISDIKTTQDNSPHKFKYTINSYAYNVQAVFYCDMLGYDPKKFRFISAETNPPYHVDLHGMTDEQINKGRDGWKKAFYYWKKYLEDKEVTWYEGYERAEDGALII